jgi:hypothetical protein
MQQNAPKHQAAFHSVGECFHRSIPVLRELHQHQNTIDALLLLLARNSQQVRVEIEIVPGAQLFVKYILLRHKAYYPPYLAYILRHLVVQYIDLSTGRNAETAQHFEQRRLSGTVRSQQAEDLPLSHTQREAINGEKGFKVL